MPIDSVASLIEILSEKRFLPPDQLDELKRVLRPRFSDVKTLAKYLVQRGWLTVYQVNQILADRAQELVYGPYIILDRIGEGGVSQVFKARHTGKNCVVALKVIREELLSNQEAYARFQREMHAVASLSHPNIVSSIDSDLEGHANFFAMEYVEGTDLGKLVQLTGPLKIPIACDYIRQAALGLQHAHEHGLVHRDIKPPNLFLTGATLPSAPPAPSRTGTGTLESGSGSIPTVTGKGEIKILDMGLARLREANTPTGEQVVALTQEGTMMGTPDYLAPEQARNAKTADIRSDIYSLGCTFYFLLTGQPPFPGNSVMQKLFQHQKEEPKPIESIRSNVPPGLSAILKKMMAKQPAERYHTPGEIANALTPFCQPQQKS
jgi:serine/threonine-protein kinase